jgi:Ca-activated chloride channel family protein
MAYIPRVLALLFLLVPALISQTSPSQSARQNTRSIAFGVFDKNGISIPGLRQDQFNIIDNGQSDTIVGLESSNKLPLRLGILMDSSNSSRGHLANEKQAANFLAGQLLHSPDDQAFVMAFNEVFDVVQDFTNNSTALKQKVDGITAAGGTAAWDAVYYACRDKLRGQPGDAPVRRVIILLSDGNDNQSHVTRAETLNVALRFGVAIYVIAPEAGGSEDILKKLAAMTGGEAFFPDKPSQWSTAVNRTRDDIQSQYLATFSQLSSDSHKEFHDVTISVNDPSLKVHAPKGYFVAKP